MQPELPEFECVVAADRARGIGKANDLPWPRLRADLRHFKDITSTASAGRRNAVIMGRRTWDSVPAEQRPLRHRLNVVVSRGELALPADVIGAGSLDAALAAAAAAGAERLFVVGGGAIYAQAFAHARCAGVYLTRIDGEFGCDTFIPPVEDRFALDPAWPARAHVDGGIGYVIEHWRRG